MTRLRIGYVAPTDPRDRWAWSGTHHYMYEALAARAAVVPLVPVPATPTSRLGRLVARVKGAPPPAGRASPTATTCRATSIAWRPSSTAA